MRRLFLPVSLLILGAAAAIVPLPLFAERPRAPLDLTGAVTVEAPEVTPVDGAFLLTAVNLRRATVADLLLSLVDDSIAFVGVPRILGPGQRDEAYFDEQRDVFAGSAEVAAAVGLEAAGFDALLGDGAQVVAVQEGSPADGALRPGDVIVAVDGEPIATSLDLVEAVTDPEAEGEERRLTVLRRNAETRVELTPRPLTRDAPQLGVRAETVDPRIELPFEVTVDAGRIGGPSAGLMVALTVYDLVDPADVAAGRRIAGTGQLDATGGIAPIGALPGKVIAADGAGADLLLVPAGQERQALDALPEGSDMQVVGVSTFADAVAALAGR